MRRIAESIEYLPTLIYHYFQDKEDVVECLCRGDFENLLGVLNSQPSPDDPLEWIRQLAKAYARLGLQYPNHYRFMFMSPAKPEQEAPLEENAYLLLRAATEKAIQSGRFRPGDPDTVAQVLWSAVHGAVSLLIAFGPLRRGMAPFASDLVDQAIEDAIRGFSKEPPREAD
jgi:AcrR family transcriptional regulator